MKTEMDALGLDERQREAWLKANRGTLLAVGLLWVGMIAWQLAHGRDVLLLAAAVPVIALLRWGLYRWYLR